MSIKMRIHVMMDVVWQMHDQQLWECLCDALDSERFDEMYMYLDMAAGMINPAHGGWEHMVRLECIELKSLIK